MIEILLAERVLYFVVSFVICFLFGIVHGYLLIKKPIIATLIWLGTVFISIASIIVQGCQEYASSWFKPEAPYIIIGTIIGLILGEILGLVIGERD